MVLLLLGPGGVIRGSRTLIREGRGEGCVYSKVPRW
jgi:hypothetical protein